MLAYVHVERRVDPPPPFPPSQAINQLCGFHNQILGVLVSRMAAHSHPEIARHVCFFYMWG